MATKKKEYEKRPWGDYEVLKREPGMWVKRIEVKPHARLSLQKHAQRKEHWIITAGRGIVRIGDNDISVEKNSVVDIPVETFHRMSNVGDEPMIFIEVAFGEYLEEDDSVRSEDDYGRA
ncbi:MAG: phosphomannose isomerase type II C-terminal cupin domain [Candidatus Omnitrophica bacterium]|nr:phosphomannose isomerase type II C-terminal cupin domain [Candidatus Omnitrophota bacterium]